MGLNGVNKPRSVQAIPGGTRFPDKPIDSMDFSPKVVIMIHHGEDLEGTGGWVGKEEVAKQFAVVRTRKSEVRWWSGGCAGGNGRGGGGKALDY